MKLDFWNNYMYWQKPKAGFKYIVSYTQYKFQAIPFTSVHSTVDLKKHVLFHSTKSMRVEWSLKRNNGGVLFQNAVSSKI